MADHNGADENVKFKPDSDNRFVEDDIVQLHQLDKQITDLIRLRNERIEMIKRQNAKNHEAVIASDDWFEGTVRGNPTEDREMAVATEVPYGRR